MKQLMLTTADGNQGDANADDEYAHMLVEDGLDLDAAQPPSPLQIQRPCLTWSSEKQHHWQLNRHRRCKFNAP